MLLNCFELKAKHDVSLCAACAAVIPDFGSAHVPNGSGRKKTCGVMTEQRSDVKVEPEKATVVATTDGKADDDADTVANRV